MMNEEKECGGVYSVFLKKLGKREIVKVRV